MTQSQQPDKTSSTAKPATTPASSTSSTASSTTASSTVSRSAPTRPRTPPNANTLNAHGVSLTNRATRAVEAVLSSPFFIGNPNLFDHVRWQEGDKVHKLVHKKPNSDGTVEEAEIEWIGEIRRDPFRLTTDGGWRSAFNSGLHKTKASATIIRAFDDLYEKAWEGVPEGVHRIQSSKKAEKAKLGNTIWVEQEKGLKVRYEIFREKDDEGREGEGENEDTEGGNKEGSWMDIWEVGKEAKDAFEELKQSGKWDVCPIPAYDINDNLIHPSEYEAKLRGAVVHVKACVQYQHLGGALNSDNFYADILELTVLKPPVTFAASPSKRKFRDRMAAIPTKVPKME